MFEALDRSATSSSFLAFEGSIEAVPDLARKRSELSVGMQVQNGRTGEIVCDTERFKGVGTLL